MKKRKLIILSLAVLMQAMAAFASGPAEMFSELDSLRNINVVLVSGEILQLVSDDASDQLKNIESLSMYSSKNRRGAETLRTRGMQIIKTSDTKRVLLQKEDGRVIAVYGRPEAGGGGDTFSQMVMMVDDSSSDVIIINMTGKLDIRSTMVLEDL